MDNSLVVLFIGAWFIQMGAHEGAHAYAAHHFGDDTAYLLGKRSFNPFNHIEWTNINSVILSVVLPCATAFIGIPMGMAWVPVNPVRLRRPSRDMAFISFAGPLANFIVLLICLFLHLVIGQLGITSLPIRLFDTFLMATGMTSLLYGVFNLIPLPPLDGSKVLRHFLNRNGQEIMDNIAQYGFIILVVLFYATPLNGLMNFVFQLFYTIWL